MRLLLKIWWINFSIVLVHNMLTTSRVRQGRSAENIAAVHKNRRKIQIYRFHGVLNDWAYPRVPHSKFCLKI